MRQDEFSAFVEIQLRPLLGYARALTGNDHDAWDLTQETLVRMGSRWEQIDRAGQPAAYARTALVRLNIDRLRRRRRERPVDQLPDDAANDSTHALDAWLLIALRRLPVRQRTAIVLRFLGDFDARGIATEMGCSVGTARSHVSRGLANLRSQAPEGSSFATLQGGIDV